MSRAVPEAIEGEPVADWIERALGHRAHAPVARRMESEDQTSQGTLHEHSVQRRRTDFSRVHGSPCRAALRGRGGRTFGRSLGRVAGTPLQESRAHREQSEEAPVPQYLSPGVYVEEVASGSRPIEGVGTSVAAFVGLAPTGPLNEPTLVTNWTQYVAAFGDFVDGYYLAHSVYGFFNNGGSAAYVVRVGGSDEDANSAAAAASAPAAVTGAAAQAALPAAEPKQLGTFSVTATAAAGSTHPAVAGVISNSTASSTVSDVCADVTVTELAHLLASFIPNHGFVAFQFVPSSILPIVIDSFPVLHLSRRPFVQDAHHIDLLIPEAF